MQAAVMTNFMEPLSLLSVELKEPGPDEVVVKMVAAGVCRTDLSVIQAHLPYPPPVVLGHEGAGVIERVGSGVRHLAAGDHVVLSAMTECGHCYYCAQLGQPHLCSTGLKAAMSGQDFAHLLDGSPVGRFTGLGCFAEKTVVRATQAIKINETVPLERACLIGCAVTTGVGAVVNRAKLEAGQTAAVFGCGGVGINVIQGAVLASASQIVAVDTDPAKLEIAKAFGATDLIDASTVSDAAEAVVAATHGRGVDFAFEATGIPDVITQAFMSTRNGGSAVVVGVAPFGAEVTIPAAILSLQERNLIGTLYGSGQMARDVPKLVSLYQRKLLKLDELVTREVGLDQINEAFDWLEKGEVIRTVIRF